MHLLYWHGVAVHVAEIVFLPTAELSASGPCIPRRLRDFGNIFVDDAEFEAAASRQQMRMQVLLRHALHFAIVQHQGDVLVLVIASRNLDHFLALILLTLKPLEIFHLVGESQVNFLS